MASSAQPAAHDPLSKRRRFQPPITSFFASAGSNASDDNDHQVGGLSYNNYSSPTHSPTPALPAKVQSSLLTVGMRIRKSVPEGYKTEPKKLTEYTVSHTVNPSGGSPAGGYTQTRSCYAELEPFCGMHKIGNLAVQTFPRPAEGYQDRSTHMSADNDDMSSLPSKSQESNASSAFSSNSHKRSYDSDLEDVDENGDDGLIHSSASFRGSITAGGIWQDPLRLNPVTETLTAAPSRSQRAILSPKLRQQRRQISSFQSLGKRSPEQENKDPSSVKNDVNMDDFEEAAFLRRREEVDADYTWDGGVEVEMGG
ncbi:hypothetical protein VTN96DRAFT_6346 [Rasamsonia emersonii]|uniref:Uncharacterized protein n=1 Tax=Rasamsonia emersonii (strain ATCC 16479 / CBS 393.64 / IMI 116815) TaxID=1408163 RepID=A0A0F4Z2Q9_RASE3|nr:hypothetical protein T310_1805 [Rasamsonia emersonii CBS 393.64]KKA24153.1 hypothetical protein T310_1805 [Rasamsonia emersonii CBS 393.64]